MSEREGEPPQAEGVEGSEKKEKKPLSFKEKLMGGGAVGNFAVQLVMMFGGVMVGIKPTWLGPKGGTADLVGRGLRYGSGGMGALHSPVVVYKERMLTQEDTFRTALNGIREEQGRLAGQNDVLTGEIDDLQSEVDRMKDIEQALRELSETQGSQLNELMELIRENKEINEGMRAVLKAKTLEEIISLVLDIDNDGSFVIENKEIDRLIIGMGLIEEISFDDKIFRKNLAKAGGNVDEVITLIKNMLYGIGEGECDEEGRRTCTIDVGDPAEYLKKQRSQRY